MGGGGELPRLLPSFSCCTRDALFCVCVVVVLHVVLFSLDPW